MKTESMAKQLYIAPEISAIVLNSCGIFVASQYGIGGEGLGNGDSGNDGDDLKF